MMRAQDDLRPGNLLALALVVLAVVLGAVIAIRWPDAEPLSTYEMNVRTEEP